MAQETALVVMAAGMGSRFGGLKQLEPIGEHGETLLDYSVYDAMAAGFDRIVFVIKHEIEEDFRRVVGDRIARKVPVSYVFQETDVLPAGYVCPADRVKPWGTGHAILCCRDAVNVPFAVVNADDYYGRSAFRKIHDALLAHPDEYAMVGFRLRNTLTENGTVSRGVCTIRDGYLADVTEHTKIRSDCRFTTDGETWQPLEPDTIVSMNLWGFTPDIFTYLERDFKAFLDRNLETPKAEFYLPFVVDDLIKAGTKTVRVLSSEDKWYGVTYREDKDAVVAAIRALTAEGFYQGL